MNNIHLTPALLYCIGTTVLCIALTWNHVTLRTEYKKQVTKNIILLKRIDAETKEINQVKQKMDLTAKELKDKIKTCLRKLENEQVHSESLQIKIEAMKSELLTKNDVIKARKKDISTITKKFQNCHNLTSIRT